MTVEWLIDPLSLQGFLKDYWGKQSLHVARNNPDYFRPLFSLADLDQLLGFSFNNKNVRMAWQDHQKSQVVYDGPNKTSICDYYDYYCEGQTVVVQNIHLRWAPIGKLCNALSREIGFRVGTHLYATPEASQGFGIHWDDHDIFALQLEGEKEWCLYDGPAAPRKSTSFREFKEQLIEDPGEPHQEVLLRAGDLLYFPRGVTHRARANKKASLHLTFGIYAVTWEDLLVKALETSQDPTFSAPLPPGALLEPQGMKDEGDRLGKKVVSHWKGIDSERVRSNLAADVIQSIQPLPDGHFADLARLESIDCQTRLCRREGMAAIYLDEGTHGRLVFPGNSIQSKSAEESEALQYSAGRQQFQVGGLPGEDDLKVSVAKALVATGVFRIEGL